MVKAIKVMLIPNNIQKTKMFQYAGASRFAYNWSWAREIENYEKGGKFITDAELREEFTKLRHSDEYAWLLSISNNVTKQAIKDACTAYKNFFKGLQKFPRFKSKKRSMPKFYQDKMCIRDRRALCVVWFTLQQVWEKHIWLHLILQSMRESCLLRIEKKF